MLFEDLPQPLNVPQLMAEYTPEELAAASSHWSSSGARGLRDACIRAIKKIFEKSHPDDTKQVNFIANLLLALPGEISPEHAEALMEATFYYYHVGKYNKTALLLGRRLIEILPEESHPSVVRRIHSILGTIQTDAADNVSAMMHYERALRIAAKSGTPVEKLATINNSLLMLGNMGLYREALAQMRPVLDAPETDPKFVSVKAGAAGSCLFWATRLHDHALAHELIERFQHLVDQDHVNESAKAYFALHKITAMIDIFDNDGAYRAANDLARSPLASSANDRVKILTGIAIALGRHAGGSVEEKRDAIGELKRIYVTTSRIVRYHAEVLRALIQVHSVGGNFDVSRAGINYAMELIEFTTRQSKVKFFHQLEQRHADIAESGNDLMRSFQVARKSLGLSSTQDDFEIKDQLGLQVQENDEHANVHAALAKMRAHTIKGELRSASREIAETWAVTAELVEDPSGEHCFRVGHLAGLLAREIGLDPDTSKQIEYAARLHDIGKCAISEMRLTKPGVLTPQEHKAMRAHAEIGAQLLEGTNDPLLQAAAIICKHHHERWDGAGYPLGLKTTAIPQNARICALAESYDAMTHDRAYRRAMSHEAAVAEIRRESGTKFDPEMVEAFLRVLDGYVERLNALGVAGFMSMQDVPFIESRDRFIRALERVQ
jgi:putative nucleotidyltransferase with HDIG domain